MSMITFDVSQPGDQPILTYKNGENPEENAIGADIALRLNNSTPGTYKQIMTRLQEVHGKEALDKYVNPDALYTINKFYKIKNVSNPWTSSLAAKPPAGEFDPTYYSKQVPEVLQNWKDAQSSVGFGSQSLPDLDVTERYGTPETYLQYHYTTTGKHTGLRANPVQETLAAKAYQEQWKPTDREQQIIRDVLTKPTATGLSLVEQTAERYINTEEESKFRSLVSDTLKQTVNELKKAKWQETQRELFAGMPEFGEIYNMGSSLTDSILGDSGVGGYLNLTGGSRAEEQFKEKFENMIGMGNNVEYNWQQWFDNVLTKRYETLEKIEDPGDAKKQYTLDKEFATRYVKDYLAPRFNTSKSMSEFIGYLDVRDNEQNVLQTQTVANRLKELATLKAESFVKNLGVSGSMHYFDPEFYFNPTGNTAKENQYATQKQIVSDAWEQAKADPNQIVFMRTELGGTTKVTWAQLAYQYGIDLNNKEQFAKLHYETLGKNRNFDGASDMITSEDLVNFIEGDLASALTAAEKNYGSNVFLEFVTPEQVADKLLKTIDPTKTPQAWKDALSKYGITDTNQPVDEIRNLLIQTIRTTPAESIRTSIEELNKQNTTPTQKLLGIEYIQRPEDKKTVTSDTQTSLYKIFQNAGYKGDENTFYNEFMPDVDRSEMELITQGQKGLRVSDAYAGLTSKDPFESIFSMEKLFPSEQESKTQPTKESDATPSYFKMFDDSSDTEYKSNSGKKILDEFTSMFKGFS